MDNNIIDTMLATTSIIPVITLQDFEQTTEVGKALITGGGLNVLEVTLRSEYGIKAISQLKQQFPNAIIGVGTVITIDQYKSCIDAGADFIVSPGSTTKLLQFASKSLVPLLPGVASISEAMSAMEYGFERLKLFPAAVIGGVKMLNAIKGPLSQLKFCPTGGITYENANDYLQLDNVICVGSTWLTPQNLLKSKDWIAIKNIAITASKL